jgi:hypothetical protein
VLKIAELVGIIFSHLDRTPHQDSGALAALARTSTGFQHTALDALWRTQYTLMNLINCMPSDLWEKVENKLVSNLRARITSGDPSYLLASNSRRRGI